MLNVVNIPSFRYVKIAILISHIAILLVSCNEKGKDPAPTIQAFVNTVNNLQSCEYSITIKGTEESNTEVFNDILLKNSINMPTGINDFDLISERPDGELNYLKVNRMVYKGADYLSIMLSLWEMFKSDAQKDITKITMDKNNVIHINYPDNFMTVNFNVSFNEQNLPAYVKSVIKINGQEIKTEFTFTYKSINQISTDILANYAEYMVVPETDYTDDYETDDEPEIFYNSDYEFDIFLAGSIWSEKNGSKTYNGLVGKQGDNEEWTLINFDNSQYFNTLTVKNTLQLEDDEEFSYCFPETLLNGVNEEDNYDMAVKGKYILGEDIILLNMEKYTPNEDTKSEALLLTTYYQKMMTIEPGAIAESAREREFENETEYKEACEAIMHLGECTSLTYENRTYTFLKFKSTEDDDYEYNIIGCDNTGEKVKLTTYCEGKIYPFTIKGELYIYVSYGSCGEGAWRNYNIYRLDGELKKVYQQGIACD